MEYEERKQILKNIPISVLDMGCWVKEAVHFSEYVDRAEETGLLYIAKRINPKIRLLQFLELPVDSGRFVIKNPQSPHFGERAIEDPEFIEHGALADAYFGWECGCHVAQEETMRARIPFELLKYGHLFYVVRAYECGAPFQDLVESLVVGEKQSLPEKEKRVEEWWSKSMEEKVESLRCRLSKELKIPRGLERRLHIIPIRLE